MSAGSGPIPTRDLRNTAPVSGDGCPVYVERHGTVTRQHFLPVYVKLCFGRGAALEAKHEVCWTGFGGVQDAFQADAGSGSRPPPPPPHKCDEIHMMARAMHFRQAPCGVPVRELRLWHSARRKESPRYAPMPQRSSSVGSYNRVAGEALPRCEPGSPSTRPLGLRFGGELQL